MAEQSQIDVSSFSPGQAVRGSASLKEGMAVPPKPFVEGDLVAIMDDIGRFAQIGKEDMAVLRGRNDSGKAGIGTARTRGEIIGVTPS